MIMYLLAVYLFHIFMVTGCAGIRTYWPAKRGGNYLQFVLYKENTDTMQAIQMLCFYTGERERDQRGYVH